MNAGQYGHPLQTWPVIDTDTRKNPVLHLHTSQLGQSAIPIRHVDNAFELLPAAISWHETAWSVWLWIIKRNETEEHSNFTVGDH